MKIISQFLFTIIVIVCVFLLLLNFNVISFNSSDLPLVLSLNQTEVGVKVQSSYQLEAIVLPSGIYHGKIVWSSSDTSIATVNSSTGYIETHKIGDVTIKASVPLNNLNAECILHVEGTDVLIKNIKISNDKINLAIGKSYQIRYTVSPSNATTHNFNFTSSDNSVAVVNEKGMIKAIGEGTAVITMKSKLNNVKDTVIINVYRYSDSFNSSVKIDDTKINDTYTDTYTYYKAKKVNMSKPSITMSPGAQSKLSATVAPSNASQKINWSSSNESYAVVNSNGVVTAKKTGNVNIIATSIDGVSAICKVTIVVPSGVTTTQPTQEAGIDITERVVKLEVGLVKTLNVNFYLIDSAKQGIAWSSSNQDIAIVKDGVVSAKSVGTCIIKAVSIDGRYNDYVTFTVVPSTNVIQLQSIKFDKDSYSASVNETITLIPIINPSNATYRFLTWTSSNRNIATVENGVVYCRGTGKVTITASSGNVSSSVTIDITSISASSATIENVGSSGINLGIGDSMYLIKKIVPLTTTDQTVSWKSSDSKVVSVDDNGMIVGLSAGSAIITVETINGKVATTLINVS